LALLVGVAIRTALALLVGVAIRTALTLRTIIIPVDAIFASVANIFVSVTTIFLSIADIFLPVAPIFYFVPLAAIVLGIDPILATIANIFSPVADIFAAIANIFATIATIFLPISIGIFSRITLRSTQRTITIGIEFFCDPFFVRLLPFLLAKLPVSIGVKLFKCFFPVALLATISLLVFALGITGRIPLGFIERPITIGIEVF